MKAAHRMMAIVLVLLALPPRTLHAQQPRQVNLQAAFDRGDRIAVELRDGRRVSGIVGSRLTAGVYIKVSERTGAETFVKYRTVRAVLDPDSGAVIGIPGRVTRDRRWVKPVVITAVVIGTLAVIPHSGIPLCLFNPHCFD